MGRLRIAEIMFEECREEMSVPGNSDCTVIVQKYEALLKGERPLLA